MADETKQPTTKAPPVTELPPGGGVVAPAEGGAVAAAAGAGDIAPPLPSGGIVLGVDDDVEKKLKAATPAFGNVLAAIGGAVAESQKGFDKAVIDSINKLNDTKIDVVTQVVIKLGDDGLPIGGEEGTEIKTDNVSVLQHYTPVFHAWKRVDVAMDLAVGAFHSQQGVTFSQKQSSTSIGAGGGSNWFGLFRGWFSASHSSSETNVSVDRQHDAEWVSGQLLVDAEIGVRKTAKFEPATEIATGPRILIQQANLPTKPGAGETTRSLDLKIEVRKATGEPVPNAELKLEPQTAVQVTLAPVDNDGKTTWKVERTIAKASDPLREFPLTLNFGDIRHPYTVVL